MIYNSKCTKGKFYTHIFDSRRANILLILLSTSVFTIISSSSISSLQKNNNSNDKFYDLSTMNKNLKIQMFKDAIALMNSNLNKTTTNEWKNKALLQQNYNNYYDHSLNRDKDNNNINDKDLFSDEGYNNKDSELTHEENHDNNNAVSVSRHRSLRHKVGYRNGQRIKVINNNNPSNIRHGDDSINRRMKGKHKKSPKSHHSLPQHNEEQQPIAASRSYTSHDSHNPFKDFTYGLGNCPNNGSQGVPCSPDGLKEMCDKYDRANGSFRSCYEACQPAFCCAHDAKNNYLAEPCQTDENCAQYSWCYIAWWKLHDTIGPASYLLIEQNDDWFDITDEEIEGDKTGSTFWNQILLHHFDNIQDIIDYEESVNGVFNTKNVFDNPEYWLDGTPPSTD